jgi:hypothetical protein
MYGNYYGGYQPQYNQCAPDQLAQLRMQQTPPVPHQQNNNGFVWVQGESGAKSFLVAPGTTVMLMDSENPVFYLKSADQSGMPMPLRVFDFVERSAQTSPQKEEAPTIDTSMFITRKEFEEKLSMLTKKEDPNA